VVTTMTSITFGSIMAARRDIAGSAIETPLVPSPYLYSVVGQEVLLKLEITQPVGTFKIRGAANAIFDLSADVAGVTCCSTGNHGRGVTFAAAKRGLRAVICMSTLVPQTKADGIKALGAESG
jgi:threonine dehydratase